MTFGIRNFCSGCTIYDMDQNFGCTTFFGDEKCLGYENFQMDDHIPLLHFPQCYAIVMLHTFCMCTSFIVPMSYHKTITLIVHEPDYYKVISSM